MDDGERERFAAILREHDYPGARLVAMRFALRLTRSIRRTQDVMGRVDLRLVRFGWDPDAISLVRFLCRLVWSEWTHAAEQGVDARRTEEGYVRELAATEGLSVPSIESQVVRFEDERARQAGAAANLEKLRAAFETAGDRVNLLWLKLAGEGQTDLQKMAAATGHDVTEFYAAAKRRKRAVLRLLAEARGVTSSGDDLLPV